MINISIDFPSSDKITSPEILKVDVNELKQLLSRKLSKC